DERNLVDLLVDQVEFADVLLLNKCDLVTEAELLFLEKVLRRLNPGAEIVRTTRGATPTAKVLNTNRFSMEQAERAPGWLRELRGEHVPETDEYGISSFVFRARRPFHPQRLWDLVQERGFKGVLRSKGFVWLATRNDVSGLWSQAGRVCSLEPAGWWFAHLPEDEWPEEESEAILADWEEPFGDRRIELVVIGVNLAKTDLQRKLFDCLLTDEEVEAGPDEWMMLDDPWPEWTLVNPEDEDEDAEEVDDEDAALSG
ncbi:MAG: GTP-binding protein, partial [Planctomycetia bacterium]